MCIIFEVLEVVLGKQNLSSDLLDEQVEGITFDLIQMFNSLLKVPEGSFRSDLHLMSFLGLLGVKMKQQDRVLCNHHLKSIIIIA